jgi:ribosomal protein S18 acetylase RimI-like enzyme
MIIRQANINDIENIMKMYDSCVIGMIKIGIDQWDSSYPNKEIILKDIQSKTFYILITDNNIIAGINIDNKQDKTYLAMKWEDKQNLFLVVHRLAVDERYWSKGAGKKLMLFAEELVTKRKLNSIRLDTYNTNIKAIEFYKNLGYKILGEIYLKPNKNEYYCFEKLIK